MIRDRWESVRVFRGWPESVVSVSCVFCGYMRCWIAPLGPGVFIRFHDCVVAVLRLFCVSE